MVVALQSAQFISESKGITKTFYGYHIDHGFVIREGLTVVGLGGAMKEVEFTQTSQALNVRAQWMRLMGLDENEIAAFCDPTTNTPVLQEELAELEAAKKLNSISLTQEQFADLAKRLPPPADLFE